MSRTSTSSIVKKPKFSVWIKLSKRLVGPCVTCEDEVDRMLRGALFVDLHKVVRQGMRASVEQHSLKDLEQFTGYEKTMVTDLRGSPLSDI